MKRDADFFLIFCGGKSLALGDASAGSFYLLRAAEAVLKGQVETIVSFHVQNISNKAERNTVPLVGNLFTGGGGGVGGIIEAAAGFGVGEVCQSEPRTPNWEMETRIVKGGQRS